MVPEGPAADVQTRREPAPPISAGMAGVPAGAGIEALLDGPWGEGSGGYLLAKGAAAGTLGLAVLSGTDTPLFTWGAGLLSAALAAAAGAALASRPPRARRFLALLQTQEWFSGPVRGAWLLSLLAGAALAWAAACALGWIFLCLLLALPVVAICLATAISAASRRDSVSPSRGDRAVGTLILLSHACLSGAATLLMADRFLGALPLQTMADGLRTALWAGLLGHLVSVIVALRRGTIAPERRATLVRLLRDRPVRLRFRGVVLVAGLAAVGAVALGGVTGDASFDVLASLLALAAAFCWSSLWARAGARSPAAS